MTPEEMARHYDRAEAAPELRIGGYHGVSIAKVDNEEIVTLYLYGENPEQIVARAVFHTSDLKRFSDALAKMIAARNL
jgi:hypothetical protein